MRSCRWRASTFPFKRFVCLSGSVIVARFAPSVPRISDAPSGLISPEILGTTALSLAHDSLAGKANKTVNEGEQS